MAVARGGSVLEHLKRLVGAPSAGDDLDRELLARFARENDGAAFAALVRRHGPMVHGVCRRMLGDAHAADDAFQATFLVLVRRAASLERRGSLAGWLHTVASRLALKAKHRAARQQARERQVLPAHPATDDLHWREVRGVLDEELNRLPVKCRLPLVLCYLQGLTRDEAAQQLEWSLATFKRRLEQGREMLRNRMERRGMGLSAGLLATALMDAAAGAAPTELTTSTVSAALAFAAGETSGTAMPSAEAIALAQGALHAMKTTKLKLAAVLLLAVSVLGAGAGIWLRPAAADEPFPEPAAAVAEQPAAPEALPMPTHKGLTMHEWGVWRIHDDLELANSDMRAVWEGLPKFVYGQVTGRDLPKFWDNRNVDRPIVFFHAKEPVDVTLRVDFPGGLPAVWWPGTQYPAIDLGKPVAGDKKLARHLEWRLRIKEAPKFQRAVGSPAVDDGHWVKTLRAVKADDVFAHVGERGFGYERERFVYYDGMLPRGTWAKLTFDKDQVKIANPAKHALLDVTVVDRRPDRTRVARVAKLNAGAPAQVLTFKDEAADQWPGAGVQALTKQLTDAGLHEDEGGSLVELWKKDLFETEGITLFYRLPQEEYDRQLPATVTPRPEKVVRVGLAVHPHCEPDLAGKVAALVLELTAEKFATRQAAQTRLEGMGRAAFVHVAKIRKQGYVDVDGRVYLGLDVKARLDRLLEKYEAKPAG